MAVNIRCPNLKCRKILKVPGTTRGQRVRCFYCGTILRVPKSRPKPVMAIPSPVEDATPNKSNDKTA